MHLVLPYLSLSVICICLHVLTAKEISVVVIVSCSTMSHVLGTPFANLKRIPTHLLFLKGRYAAHYIPSELRLLVLRLVFTSFRSWYPL